jgi:sugar lactone lactonase YvrE
MEGRVVHRLEPDGPVVHADLRDLAAFQLNDMVVATDGTAYVSQFGYDMWGGGAYTDTVLIRVDPDGTAVAVADDLASPNGMAITPDGMTLVVAEPGAARLSHFRITLDGLADRVVVPLEKAPGAAYVTPDGICVDVEGAVWAADPMGGRVIRVLDGRIERELPIAGTHPLACVLGGDDRRTLFVCTGEQVSKPTRTPEATGRVVTFEVDAPGAGIP